MFRKLMIVICVFALLAGCTGKKEEPTQTPLPPTATLIPPTNTAPPPTPKPTEAELSVASAGGPYPMARVLSNIVYNPKTDQALIVGGMLSTVLGTYSMEDWYFDAQTKGWMYDGRPVPLGCGWGSPVIYDSHAERVLLYCPGSGVGVGAKAGVWELTPENMWVWTDRQSANTPAASVTVRMAYDAESQKSIIIGGLNYETWQTFNETWAYDYDTNTWTKMNPKTTPPGLYAHAMAYDSESDRVILWGGEIFTGDEINWTSEAPENLVWAYDYNTDTWESLPVTNGPAHPGTPQIAQMVEAAYAPDVDRTYFYWSDQLWAYDYNHNAWEKAKGDVMSGAGSRIAHSIVYLDSIQRLLVFGGATIGKDWMDMSFNNDTWLYDPQTGEWTKVGP